MSIVGKVKPFHGQSIKMNKGKPVELPCCRNETTRCIPETGNNVHKGNVPCFVLSVIKSHHMSFNQSVTLAT